MKTSHPEPPEDVCYWEKKKRPKVAPDLLKALAILSDATIRRSAVDQENLKSYEKSEVISVGDQQSYYLQVFRRLY